MASLPSLMVVAQCTCGCASVDFTDTVATLPRSQLLADAVAGAPPDNAVGLIIWGHPHAITALEIYDQSGSDANRRLPDPTSIQAFFPTG
jgi:hypothetical protein